jgi:hypothetical protein
MEKRILFTAGEVLYGGMMDREYENEKYFLCLSRE